MRVSRPFALFALLVLAACSGGPRPPARLPDRKPPPVAPARPVAKPQPRPPQKPAPVVKKVQPQAQANAQGRVHVVQAGDTGIGIARAYGVRWSELVALNALAPPFTLKVGDRLKLPSAQAVASRTLEERARAFDLNIDDIVTGGEPAAPAIRRPVPPPGAAATPAAPVAAPAPLPALPANAPRFAWPVEGRVLSGFGPKPGGRFNDGVNLKASAGQAVRAAGDGVVAYAGDAIPGFGNLLL
ncbi:MAG: M23 family metallopeptidase, partial [Sphingomonadales bacterium]